MVNDFDVLQLQSTSDKHGRYPSFTLAFVEPVDSKEADIREAVRQYVTEMGVPPVDEIEVEDDHATIKFSVKDHDAYEELLHLAEKIHGTYPLDHAEHGFRGRRFERT